MAFAALWFTLAVECAYIIVARFVLNATWGHLIQPLVFVF